MYGAFLPKGNHPFIYMNLLIEPNNVDVNIHPTKHEVHFLYEDEIIEQIRQKFEEKLIGSNEAREIYTQSLLPGASQPIETTDDNDQSKETKVYAKDMVRSDSKEQKLEKFFGQCVIKTASNSSQMSIEKSISDFTQDDINESLNASQSQVIVVDKGPEGGERK